MKTTDDFPRVMDGRLFLSVLAAGLLSFTGVVIETAMNVTFPTLMKEFSVSISTVQWITTGYLLMLSIVIPASAFLKKRFSAKSIFITANLIFSA
ncbi:MAG: MFS transporter, partial [Selenomonas sp.]|nr:MFS transporter [Selenomonas sp.]